MRLVGVIAARGGSKGIQNKNIFPCAGKPLLAYTAIAAKQAVNLSRVILSTDDPAIAEIGRKFGIEVPFMRPGHLAGDDSLMIDVLKHTLKCLEDSGESIDGLVLLQPTSPLRKARHIDSAISVYEQHSPATVVSVMATPHQFTPNSLMVETDGVLRPWLSGEPVLKRQDKPEFWARNGPAVLVMHPSEIREGRIYGERVVGFRMDSRSSLDVDTMEDLARAEWELLHNSDAGYE